MLVDVAAIPRLTHHRAAAGRLLGLDLASQATCRRIARSGGGEGLASLPY
jgi:hypothetical protein